MKHTSWLYLATLFLCVFLINAQPTQQAEEYNEANSARQLETIRLAYEELGRRVNIALRSQVGDSARLEEQHQAVNRFLSTISDVRELFYSYCLSLNDTLQRQDGLSPNEFGRIERGLLNMLDALDEAHRQSSESSNAPHLQVRLLKCSFIYSNSVSRQRIPFILGIGEDLAQ